MAYYKKEKLRDFVLIALLHDDPGVCHQDSLWVGEHRVQINLHYFRILLGYLGNRQEAICQWLDIYWCFPSIPSKYWISPNFLDHP